MLEKKTDIELLTIDVVCVESVSVFFFWEPRLKQT